MVYVSIAVCDRLLVGVILLGCFVCEHGGVYLKHTGQINKEPQLAAEDKRSWHC